MDNKNDEVMKIIISELAEIDDYFNSLSAQEEKSGNTIKAFEYTYWSCIARQAQCYIELNERGKEYE